MTEKVGISRRSMFKALPAAVLVAASDGILSRQSAAAAPAPAAFPQPAVRARRRVPGTPRAVLEQTLDVRFTDTVILGYGTATTRTYNGTIPGPTLRVRGGDTLRLTQVNGLPPNEPHSGGHNRPHNLNSFNLHTHGLHVSPSGDADNVHREFAPRTADEVDAGAPEPQYLTTVDIPADHPAGTHWYHPHLHGATAVQIVGGMAGVLIVEGDVDEVPEIAAAADLVVCVNELRLKDGKVPDFTSGNALTAVPATLTVNGAVNPTLTLRPGEVQRWRLVCATAFTALPLRLTDGEQNLTFHQIAQDGVTFPATVATDRLRLAMGNRADVLVRGGDPGRYELRADRVTEPLMTVQVAGDPVDPPMDLPTTLPAGKPFLDADDIANPDADREVVFHVDPGVLAGPFPNAFRVLGSNPTPAADPDGDLTRDPAYGLFDPGYVNHTLGLDTVERWTLRTDETNPAFSHPFHLHTNHVLVTHRNGEQLDPPVWQDTIDLAGGEPGDTVTFLVRYEDFTGSTVAHCHQLQHEDLGMMQTVEYVEPRRPGGQMPT
ncbi:multicopper oxidase family protein [Kitasatospora cathayae]|uniref:Multicopper oxidase domain-containing protein n=1 Tax=Kitasatospora cathayae TaxID=3004092 RepID=A0ABY7PXU9_9ACTN|nr:multicopper oxidase domain-containing protein [Kitasatospora sp. HUAS 3-15]WBP85277.1 multicopper oxidase domain-containing protein [Kitasatospora sp. HUAS 3-15]